MRWAAVFLWGLSVGCGRAPTVGEPRPTPAARADAVPLVAGYQPLASDFDAAAGHVRVVALLSPT